MIENILAQAGTMVTSALMVWLTFAQGKISINIVMTAA
jgi:hypothetical protein